MKMAVDNGVQHIPLTSRLDVQFTRKCQQQDKPAPAQKPLLPTSYTACQLSMKYMWCVPHVFFGNVCQVAMYSHGIRDTPKHAQPFLNLHILGEVSWMIYIPGVLYARCNVVDAVHPANMYMDIHPCSKHSIHGRSQQTSCGKQRPVKMFRVLLPGRGIGAWGMEP
jgi:hypothetical protein